MKAQDAVEHLRQHASGVDDKALAAPANIPVGADENRTIGLNGVERPPRPLGIAELSAASYHMRNQRRLRVGREPRHGVDPASTLRSGQQHKATAEQVDRRQPLAGSFEPGRPVAPTADIASPGR